MEHVQIFMRDAFAGQTRRVIEASIAGGIVGVSLSFFREKLTDSIENVDKRLLIFTDLTTFDSEIPYLLTELLRIVSLFVPSLVSRTLLLSEYMNDLATCVIAAANTELLPATSTEGLAFLSYKLSYRISRIISDINISLPYDSPARTKAEDFTQRIYDYRMQMDAEIRGYSRLAQSA